MQGINDQIAEALARVREQKPLLHHITNYVVMNDTANVTLHIGALAGAGGEVKGVESVGDLEDRAGVSRRFAASARLVVAMSGKRDFLSDGERVLGVDNGDKWLTTLTGTGCMSTTMIGAFAAVEKDPLIAAAAGYAAFGLAAEIAAPHAHGPASFKVAFFDQLYHLTPDV